MNVQLVNAAGLYVGRRIYVDLTKGYEVNYAKLRAEQLRAQAGVPEGAADADQLSALEKRMGGTSVPSSSAARPNAKLPGMGERGHSQMQNVIQRLEAMYENPYDSDEGDGEDDRFLDPKVRNEVQVLWFHIKSAFLLLSHIRDSNFRHNVSVQEVQRDRKRKDGDMYYDTDDEFIDDEELNDQCVVETRKAKHDGFYIQKGMVQLKEGGSPAVGSSRGHPVGGRGMGRGLGSGNQGRGAGRGRGDADKTSGPEEGTRPVSALTGKLLGVKNKPLKSKALGMKNPKDSSKKKVGFVITEHEHDPHVNFCERTERIQDL
eukprot:1180966-Prorocentrum_minimum.AAC.4